MPAPITAVPQPYRPADYLLGKVKVPPSINNLEQKSYVYGGDISVTNGNSGLLSIQIQADACFLVEGINVLTSSQTATEDNISIVLTDTTYSQAWSNVAGGVTLRDLAGKGDNTKWLTDPNLIRPSSTFNFGITNNSGGTLQIYCALIGRKIYGMTDDDIRFMTRRMWYQYVMQVPTIAAGITGTLANLQIYNESDFLLKKMYSTDLWKYVIGATAGSVSAEVLMNIRDTTNDRNFFNQNLAARLVLGTQYTDQVPVISATYPMGNGQGFQFRRPALIRRNGTLQGVFDNLSAGSTGAFNVVFEGTRIFDAQ